MTKAVDFFFFSCRKKNPSVFSSIWKFPNLDFSSNWKTKGNKIKWDWISIVIDGTVTAVEKVPLSSSFQIHQLTERLPLFFAFFHIRKNKSEAKMKPRCVYRKHCRGCNLFNLRVPHLSKNKTTKKTHIKMSFSSPVATVIYLFIYVFFFIFIIISLSRFYCRSRASQQGIQRWRSSQFYFDFPTAPACECLVAGVKKRKSSQCHVFAFLLFVFPVDTWEKKSLLLGVFLTHTHALFVARCDTACLFSHSEVGELND